MEDVARSSRMETRRRSWRTVQNARAAATMQKMALAMRHETFMHESFDMQLYTELETKDRGYY